jgi:2,5-diketo-D-gluconate reductase B
MPPLDLGFGLGTSGLDDPTTCTETVVAALEAGYRHVDTAQMYDNEAAVGDGIAAAGVDRDEVVVATKVHPENLAPDEFARRHTRVSTDWGPTASTCCTFTGRWEPTSRRRRFPSSTNSAPRA